MCVVDAQGKIVRDAKVASEAESLVAFFGSLGFAVKRIGLEAGHCRVSMMMMMRDAVPDRTNITDAECFSLSLSKLPIRGLRRSDLQGTRPLLAA